MSSFYQNRNTDPSKQIDTPQSAYLTNELIISWLGLAEAFQTFGQQDEAKIEQDIQDIRALLDEDGEETPRC